MKQDAAVSEVLGTILLVALVVCAAGLLALFSLNLVLENGDTAPDVSLRASASPYHLYHAGGDALLKTEIRIYSQSTDITEKTRINGKKWDVWKTGDYLYLTDGYNVKTVTVVGKTSSGEEVLLFEGLRK